MRSTPSPFHFQIANPNDSLQGHSSGRNLLETSVPHSNNYLSVQHDARLIFFKIRNTNVGEITEVCDISSYVARRSSARQSATSFTLPSSVDVFGLLCLTSYFMVTPPSRIRVTQRENVLRATVCSLQLHAKHCKVL